MNINTIVIDFPLRGEWFVKVSPADHVPSHGTNRFGLRYAMDFIKIDWNDPKYSSHNKNALDYLMKGIPLENFYCFGQPIFAPFAGQIVAIENSVSDGERASWITDQTTAIRHSLFFNAEKDGFKAIAGNYVILKKEEGIYAAFCHIQKDSICVKIGDKVYTGQQIGKVGHSGNSTEPHLHFQLMDSDDLEHTTGLPFVFEQYEKYDGSKWVKVIKNLPTANDYIRSAKTY